MGGRTLEACEAMEMAEFVQYHRELANGEYDENLAFLDSERFDMERDNEEIAEMECAMRDSHGLESVGAATCPPEMDFDEMADAMTVDEPRRYAVNSDNW